MTRATDSNIKALRDTVAKTIQSHDYETGPLLVLAGPGSGKTRSLIQTMKRQMASGLDADDFLECTLTNAAADKFAADVREQLSVSDPDVCTLHSRAKGILHHHSAALRLRKDFAVLSEQEYVAIAEHDLGALLGASPSRIGSRRHKYQEEAAGAVSPSDARFASAYRSLQRFYGAVDWYDIIALARELLQQRDDLRDAESGRFGFLLVDEYQDLNEAEQQLLELLLNGRDTLLAVGDDDQSIYYGIRYAAPVGIVNFKSRFPRATTMSLPVTSRLPSAILRSAYTLVERNAGRSKGRDRPRCLPATDEKANGGLSLCVNCKSGKAEAEFIASALAVLKNKVPDSKVLVLCPNIPLGAELATRLEKHHPSIPLSVELRDESTTHNELLRVHASRFLSDIKDNFSLRFLLADIIGAADACSSLVQGAMGAGRSLWREITVTPVADSIARARLEEFRATVSKARRLHDLDARLDYLASHTPQLSGLSATPDKATEPRDDSRASHPARREPLVRLMSLHKSKGLDADFVFIPFMEKSVGLAAKDTEEQRRLLFVAMTRARVGCIMSWAWSRRGAARYKTKVSGGQTTCREPSPFISDCGIPTTLCPHWHTPAPPEMALTKLAKCASHVARYDESHSESST